MLVSTSTVEYDYATIDDAFPAVDPGVEPFGSRVLVQFILPKRKTKGGIYLTTDTQEAVASNVQAAKVIALGPLAFHNRTTREVWPEGAWAEVGSFVRAPKYGGDRWEIPHGDDRVTFVLFNDLDLLGRITGDPRTVKAYL